MSKLYVQMLMALLIAAEIACLWMTLSLMRKLWDRILTLSQFKRMDLEFASGVSPDGVLYWRRNKVRISLYLALNVIYAGVGAAATVMVGLGLSRLFLR